MRTPVWTPAKLLPAAIALAALGIGGTVGFHLIFGSPWPLGLYQTLVTASTLGDPRLIPHTDAQYGFIAAITVVGYATWALMIALLAGTLVSLDVRSLWGGRRGMEERIAELRGHIVVVGAGRVGQQVAQELMRVGRTVVLIDRDPQRVDALVAAGLLALSRDAMEEEVLEAAGLARSAGVVLALPDDAQNLYVLFAVRDVAPQAVIVARAESARAEKHLRALGVQRVVMPTVLGGKRMARLLARPLASEFLDSMIEDAGLQLREHAVAGDDPLVGRRVRELRDVFNARVTLLAVRRDGRVRPLPPAPFEIRAGDTLLLVTVEPPEMGE